MITTEDWYNFISKFFTADKKWIHHVLSNWNHIKNEPGCDCRTYILCQEWLEQYAAIIKEGSEK